jgi:hypothetical protein
VSDVNLVQSLVQPKLDTNHSQKYNSIKIIFLLIYKTILHLSIKISLTNVVLINFITVVRIFIINKSDIYKIKDALLYFGFTINL